MLYDPIDVSDESSFDEDDEVFMKEISESVASVIPEIFPTEIQIVLTKGHCQLHYGPFNTPKDVLVECLWLVESNLKII